jgi:hypothetical protein
LIPEGNDTSVTAYRIEWTNFGKFTIKRIIGQIPQIDKRSVQEGMAGSVIIRVLSRRVIASVMSKSTGMPQPPPVGVPMTLPSLRSGREKG